ncbi:MAG: hypothetical protein SGARI_007576, partial [Bacillariaceae sp.]
MASGKSATETATATAVGSSIGSIGLLNKMENPSDATWYTTDLDDLLEKDGVFWQAAIKDAGNHGNGDPEMYLANLLQKIWAYMGSDHVFGRKTLKSEIKKKITDNNAAAGITVLLGAQNSGKTKVLSAAAKEVMMEEDNNIMVVYINAREISAGSMKDGIAAALNKLESSNFFTDDFNWKEIGTSLTELKLLLRHNDSRTKKFGGKEAFENLASLEDAMKL